VTDAPAVAAALATVRAEWGPITGVILGAGVLADQAIADKTLEQFDAVFATKVAGLHALLDATASDPLKLLVLFSSVAGRTGNTGQSDYAMANQVLDAVAGAEQARRGPGCRVASMAWGPWQGGMVTPALAEHFARLGVPLIPLAEGAGRLVDEATGGSDAVQVVIGGQPGSGPLGAPADKALVADVLVGPTDYPWLADHTIADTPVVPVVLALEWFARAAGAVRPDLHLAEIRDVRVLRGVQVHGWETGGDRLTVRARQVSNGDGAIVEVALEGTDGRPTYTATVQLSETAPTRAAGQAPDPGALKAWRGAIYDGHTLFHGPKLQVIQELRGVSEEGLEATLVGGAGVGWPPGAWRTDPALYDGALQLAVLLAQHRLGGASLPTHVQAFRPHVSGLVQGPVTGRVVAREVHATRVVSDIVLLDADGRLIGEVRGLETHLRPGEPHRDAASQPRA